jgi:hypothetical protein
MKIARKPCGAVAGFLGLVLLIFTILLATASAAEGIKWRKTKDLYYMAKFEESLDSLSKYVLEDGVGYNREDLDVVIVPVLKTNFEIDRDDTKLGRIIYELVNLNPDLRGDIHKSFVATSLGGTVDTAIGRWESETPSSLSVEKDTVEVCRGSTAKLYLNILNYKGERMEKVVIGHSLDPRDIAKFRSNTLTLEGLDIGETDLTIWARSNSRAKAQVHVVVVESDGAPEIRRIVPDVGWESREVRIVGKRFDPEPKNNTIVFKGDLASVYATEATDTSLTAIVPPRAETGPVIVETEAGRRSNPFYFRVDPIPKDASKTWPVVGTAGTLAVGAGWAYCLIKANSIDSTSPEYKSWHDREHIYGYTAAGTAVVSAYLWYRYVTGHKDYKARIAGSPPVVAVRCAPAFTGVVLSFSF